MSETPEGEHLDTIEPRPKGWIEMTCIPTTEYKALRQRVDELTGALQRVSDQVPNAIGGEPYLISCGALYAVRAALDASQRTGDHEASDEKGRKNHSHRV